MTPTPSFTHPAPLAEPSVTVDASCPPPTTDFQPGHQAQALRAATLTTPLAPSVSTPPAQVATPITAPSPRTSKPLKGVSVAKQLYLKTVTSSGSPKIKNFKTGPAALASSEPALDELAQEVSFRASHASQIFSAPRSSLARPARAAARSWDGCLLRARIGLKASLVLPASSKWDAWFAWVRYICTNSA
ncbi:hypothetical protein EDB84DRAFT_1565567 [Lactarius hengduanensis]|nr:hypothetical protein EDB84DRAFT_1565567 [Lactarius hengduanensis]